jgi:hypothetical protein
MIHPHTELRHISDDIGLGVIATRLIPRGTITWALDPLDFVIEPDALTKLPAAQLAFLERYSYVDPRGRHVLCWDAGRYVNHACDASTAPLGTICDIAVRDILPGEELTCDYATLNIRSELNCRCGAAGCRGLVRAEDLPALAAGIDALLAQAVADAPRVEQLLWPAMLADERARLIAVTSGAVAIPSCLDMLAPTQESLRAGAGGLWAVRV